MQTFPPYPSFWQSLKCLDRQRLGKQRIETLQILRVLHGLSNGWSNHPTVRMWRGYENALAEYGVIACRVWKERGYKDSTQEKIEALRGKEVSDDWYLPPPWFGDEDFHRAHRSNLLRKNPEHYGGLPGFDVPDDLPYVWSAGEAI